MGKNETTRRGRLQFGIIAAECVILAFCNAIFDYAIPFYITEWFSVGLYVVLCSLLLLAHVMVFKKSTKTVTLLLAFTLVFFLSSLLIDVFKIKDGVWPSWARSNLSNIQLSLERYAVDHDGHYPEYLIGGQVVKEPTNLEPLLYGYIESYPRNEAARSGMSIPPASEFLKGYSAIRKRFPWLIGPYYYWLLPEDIAAFNNTYRDHYSGNNGLSRFGIYGTLMGNMGADYRFAEAKWGYPFWERRKGSRDLLTIGLQGRFYYKALYKPGSKQPDGYILMLFGTFASDGIDAFTTVPGGHELDGRLPDGSGVGMGVPVIPELGLEGDGKPDGVYIVLHGGWPVKAFE